MSFSRLNIPIGDDSVVFYYKPEPGSLWFVANGSTWRCRDCRERERAAENRAEAWIKPMPTKTHALFSARQKQLTFLAEYLKGGDTVETLDHDTSQVRRTELGATYKAASKMFRTQIDD